MSVSVWTGLCSRKHSHAHNLQISISNVTQSTLIDYFVQINQSERAVWRLKGIFGDYESEWDFWNKGLVLYSPVFDMHLHLTKSLRIGHWPHKVNPSWLLYLAKNELFEFHLRVCLVKSVHSKISLSSLTICRWKPYHKVLKQTAKAIVPRYHPWWKAIPRWRVSSCQETRPNPWTLHQALRRIIQNTMRRPSE